MFIAVFLFYCLKTGSYEEGQLKQLFLWQHDPLRMSLIIRGARQVGKSWLVNEFSQQFDNFIELNFDWDDDACSLFEGKLTVTSVLEKIQFYTGKKITAGKTLLFLDEIQECPRALKLLRYFKEQCPELHVIAAGSLLDFILDEVGMPVGRVQFLYLYPLSFGEFLTVLGRADLRDYITKKNIDPAIHKMLLESLKTYMWLGGMPAVVDAWFQLKDSERCQALQDSILTAYRQDFNKYARKNQISNIEKVFASIPQQLGNKFKYSHVDQDKKALH